MDNETSIIGGKENKRKSQNANGKNPERILFKRTIKSYSKELGEIEDGKDETSNLNKAILKAKMPKRYKKIMLNSKAKKHESNVSRGDSCRKYLDWMIDLLGIER